MEELAKSARIIAFPLLDGGQIVRIITYISGIRGEPLIVPDFSVQLGISIWYNTYFQ